ncbi:unnamed protein product [Closterium sp. NIES-64]|nr:unnamed protein product [Closterium sp. NIES-64]
MASGAGGLWHPEEVRRDELKAGDHIFSWRIGMSYSHHGVYVGADEVIHFTRQQADEIGSNALLDYAASVSPALQRTTTTSGEGSEPCRACGTEGSSHGVISSCLRCFLHGGALFRFDYGVSVGSFCLQMRGGTCSMAVPDAPHAVVQRARLLLKEGFGRYHVLDNNCEDFAVYCKTRALVVDKTRVGTSGQSAAFFGFNFASATAAVPLLLVGPLAAAAVFAGSYSLSRVALDVGVRRDVVRVEGEELVASLKGLGIAEARPEGVNKPELLPKEFTTVIDVADFLSAGQPLINVSASRGVHGHECGGRMAGLAIRDYWGVWMTRLWCSLLTPTWVSAFPAWIWCMVDGHGAWWMGMVHGGWAWCMVDGHVHGGWAWCMVDGHGAWWMGMCMVDGHVNGGWAWCMVDGHVHGGWAWSVTHSFSPQCHTFYNPPFLLGSLNSGNLLNFNVGATVDLSVPRSFWSRLAGKYGNVFYWREKGEDAAIEAAVIAIDNCLREDPGPRQCAEIK